jgi:hypothetical protein
MIKNVYLSALGTIRSLLDMRTEKSIGTSIGKLLDMKRGLNNNVMIHVIKRDPEIYKTLDNLIDDLHTVFMMLAGNRYQSTGLKEIGPANVMADPRRLERGVDVEELSPEDIEVSEFDEDKDLEQFEYTDKETLARMPENDPKLREKFLDEFEHLW